MYTSLSRPFAGLCLLLLFILPVVSPGQELPGVYPGNIKINYIRTWTATAPVSDPALLLTRPLGDVKQTTQYFDGLGRLLQTVARQQSQPTNGTAVDLVSPVVYDAFGRETFKFLPFAANGTGSNASINDGLLKLNPFQQQAAFYNSSNTAGPLYDQGETFYYSKTNFEASPLNRVEQVLPPGNSWVGAGRGVSTRYWLNTAVDAVKIWRVTEEPGGLGTYYASSNYLAGELYKNVTADELGNQVIEFKDKEGQVVLKKVQLTASADNGAGSGHTGWLCTYYLYDDLNQLRAVIQPKGVEALAANLNWVPDAILLSEQCFRYAYDARRRISLKKVPGAAAVQMVYDVRDRLVFVQDGNLRTHNQWLGTLYDGLNRPVLTGLIEYNGTRDVLQQLVTMQTQNGGDGPAPEGEDGTEADLELNGLTGSGAYFAYNSITLAPGFESVTGAELTAEIIPGGTGGGGSITEGVTVNLNPIPENTPIDILTVMYYDDHGWTSSLSPALKDFSAVGAMAYLQTASNTTAPYAQPVQASIATKGLVTGAKVKVLGSGPVQYLTTVNFYDDKARLVQARAQNITDGIDVLTMQYNWGGQPLVTVQEQEKKSDLPHTATVATLWFYDEQNRVTKVQKKVRSSLVNNNQIPANWTTIAENEYDALGQLKSKKLGNKYSGETGTPTGDELTELDYAYTIRGWLNSINKDYLTGDQAGGDLYFGMELGYDKNGFESTYAPQYTGNISGTIWKSAGDGQKRKYDFSYDPANRLTGAAFGQYAGGSGVTATYNISASIDFSVTNLAYDANGNIQHMEQKGVKGAGSDLIDNLSYHYYPGSNRLQNVIDAINDPQTRLGDFRSSQAYLGSLGGTKTESATDYSYDANGNLIKDLNKDIDQSTGDGIEYNHLNLPAKIHVKGKGTIEYIYDALGNKLKKVATDQTTTPQPTIRTTLYLAGFEYKNDTLQQIAHEEGRIRYTKKFFYNGDSIYQCFYDYFQKDHLGNVRMVLTEQKDTMGYFATMEPGSGNAIRNKENQLFSNIDVSAFPAGNVPGGYPTDHSLTNPNEFISRLNGSSQKTGPSIVLKVMTGDMVDLAVKSFYRPQGGAGGNTSALSDVLMTLAGGIVSVSGETKGTLAQLSDNSSSPLLGTLNLFRSGNNPDQENKPKAFLNWILLDEQFNYVGAYPQSGALPVESADILNTLAYSGINITRNGYLYIYTSNETLNWDVFFDNLAIRHYTGPVLEEMHYYPFGLVMSGISSKSLSFGNPANRFKYNSKEEQRQEFSDGSGLEWLDYGARFYDNQLGRWHVLDPHSFNYYGWTPYNYCANNPIAIMDPTGMDWYKDEKGRYQYDPTITKDSKLEKGQTYVGVTYQVKDKKGNVIENYRKDGSIMYAKESSAYGRIIERSKQTGNESMAVITDKGTLVMPDYKNNSTTVDLANYNYSIKNGNIVDGSGVTYNTVATVHTHPNGSGPSTYTADGYGDLGFAAFSTPNKPVFVLQMQGTKNDPISFIISSSNTSRTAAGFNNYAIYPLTQNIPSMNVQSIQSSPNGANLKQFIKGNNLLQLLRK